MISKPTSPLEYRDSTTLKQSFEGNPTGSIWESPDVPSPFTHPRRCSKLQQGPYNLPVSKVQPRMCRNYHFTRTLSGTSARYTNAPNRTTKPPLGRSISRFSVLESLVDRTPYLSPTRQWGVTLASPERTLEGYVGRASCSLARLARSTSHRRVTVDGYPYIVVKSKFEESRGSLCGDEPTSKTRRAGRVNGLIRFWMRSSPKFERIV